MFSRSIALTVALAATTLGASAALAAPSTASDQVGSHASVLLAPAEHDALMSSAQADAPALAKALGLGADDTLKVKAVTKDADGATHIRVDRVYKGLPVVGGDMVIHRDAAGAVVGHSSTFDGAITVDTKPTLSKVDSGTRGLAAAEDYKNAKDDGLSGATVAGNKLVVFIHDDGTQSLAYEVTTTGIADDKTPSQVKSYVDADSGAELMTYDEIIASLSAGDRAAMAKAPRKPLTLEATGNGRGIWDGSVSLETSGSGGRYELRNPQNGNFASDSHNRKVTGEVFTDSDNQWGNGTNSDRASAGVDAEFGADKTFEFYKNVMGRNGIWDNGRGAQSRVHYDTGYVNAFWNGTMMTYGDAEGDRKPLTELDVAAHEMSHGVNQESANLAYSGDPGGLNEANSDILGTAVEWYANLPADPPDYFIGEKIDLRGNGQPLRWMDKPSRDGRTPDCWSRSVANLDPHYANGPGLHWFYLAAEGSGSKTINGASYTSATCDGSTVTGGGRDNIWKVWYRALANHFTSRTTYPQAREDTIKSAIELYGASSQVCRSVQSAWNAVAVPAGSAKCSGGNPTPPPTSTPPVPPSTSTPPVPPTSTTTSDPNPPQPGGAIVNGGLEQGQQGWTGTDGPITDNSGRPAHSGSWKMWLGGNGQRATETEQQTFTVPAGSSRLSYYVAVDTDEKSIYMAFDTVKVTVNGQQVASYSNQDRRYGYQQKSVDLSRWAGQQVTLKLTMNEDSMNQTSFVFDDFSLS